MNEKEEYYLRAAIQEENPQPQPLTAAQRDAAAEFIQQEWGIDFVVCLNGSYQPSTLSGFFIEHDWEWLGLITYDIVGDACQIVTLNSTIGGLGIGIRLVDAIKMEARKAGCHRLWLTTTNDNTHALRFYQKYGFALVTLHRDIIKEWRKLKPQLPLLGNDGISIRDAIELEIIL